MSNLSDINTQKYKYRLVSNLNIPFPYKALHKDNFANKATTLSEVIKNTKTQLIPNWSFLSTHGNLEAKTEIYFSNEFNPLKHTFVFHHGLLITNHRHNLQVFTSKEFHDIFNVVSIKMAWHKSALEGVKVGLSDFEHILLMISSSVLAMEEMVKFHRKVSDKKIVLCGTSMGGIVSSNHFFYLDTADLYFPLVAYPNFGRMLIRDKYKLLIADFDKASACEAYLSSMDVPEDILKNADKTKVFPILAENDELVEFEDSRRFWEGYDVMTTQTGHFDIIKDREKIRNLIIAKAGE